MRSVQREDLLDYVTYEEQRSQIRADAMTAKSARRIHVGEHLTFLFENRTTVRYQVQEMMRAERMVKEADILRELSTYNELLGRPGEFGCTLLVEIPDAKERDEKLASWHGLPGALYALLDDGTKVRPTIDERQNDPRRISSVQFMKFETGNAVPAALGSDLAELRCETSLTYAQREALRVDLADL